MSQQVPPPTQQTPPTPAESARNTMAILLVAGLLSTAGGVALAVTQRPETTISTDAFETTSQSGSDAGYAIGLIAAGIGSTLLWISLVAYGVALGIRSTWR